MLQFYLQLYKANYLISILKKIFLLNDSHTYDPQTNRIGPQKGFKVYLKNMYRDNYFLIFFSRFINATICDITIEASSDSVDSRLLKP